MEAKKAKKNKVRGIKNAFIVIIICFIVALVVFTQVLGAPENFEGGDPAGGHPLNLLGTIYKGGFIVPILQTLLLTVIVLSVERFIAMLSVKGTASFMSLVAIALVIGLAFCIERIIYLSLAEINTKKFLAAIEAALEKGDIAGAQALCDKQRGTVASVVSSALIKYSEVEKDDTLSKEQKIEAIKKQLEEAAALEMPSMQQNLPIVATMTTLGTLVGLLGTVLGMIKSFQALATAGAPDSVALSTGISEALVNTAFGIATGALAVISYNYFSNKIDNVTYAIDEVGFCIVNTFAATHK